MSSSEPRFRPQPPPVPYGTPGVFRVPRPSQGVYATPRCLTLGSDPIFKTTEPRIGGILPDGAYGEPWTGGSNINPPTMPTHVTQRRPYKYNSSAGLLKSFEKGIPEKLGTEGEKTTCTFEHWMRLQSNAHERYGLDTVFKVPNATWTSELNLFECNSIQWKKLEPWVNQLLNGIDHPINGKLPPCQYNK